MSATSVILGLVLAVIAYVVLAIILANWLAALIAAAVFVVFTFGGLSLGGRRTTA